MQFRESTQYIDDESFQVLPSLTPQQQARMQQQHRQKTLNFYNKNKKYEIDYWYPAIKQFTFNSFCFPLTVMQAYVLHCLYYENEFTEQIKQAQANLVAKINKLIEENANQNNKGKFFMKMSTRSPKDYCWDYRDVKQFDNAVENLIKYIQKQNITSDTPPQQLNNWLYKFFLQNSQQKLLIKSGQDFVRIFSKSQRIITDINDFSYLVGGVFQKIKEKKLSEQIKKQRLINIWARDWDNCKWQEQFRCFYCQYKLNAISQYDQRCFFPGLAKRKDQIAEKIQKLFQKARPRLQSIGLQKGVIDIVVKHDQVKIVQINVFDGDARASLFNWNQDRKILQQGPLQIRVLQKEKQISKAQLGSIMGMIDKKSTDVIYQALQKKNLLSIWK